MPKISAQLLLLISVALWGISSPVAKYALGYLSPQLLLFLRFLIITIFLTPYIYINRKKFIKETKKFSTSNWVKLITIGFLGSVAQIGLIYLGFTYTTAIDGTLLLASSPIIVALAGLIFLKETLTKREVLGFIIAGFGSLLLVIKPLIETGQIFTGSGIGNSLILAANLCWAIYIVTCKSSGFSKLSPIFLTWITFFTGTLGMGMISLISTPLPQIITTIQNLNTGVIFSLLYVSLGAGIIAYTFYQLGLKSIEVSEAEVFNYLSPIFATPIAYLWLKEPITLTFILSAIIIAIGVYLAETNPVIPHRKH